MTFEEKLKSKIERVVFSLLPIGEEYRDET
jgi:hypothetical protein